MKRILLVNQKTIPHYRTCVYNRLSSYLETRGMALTVVSEGFSRDGADSPSFRSVVMRLRFKNLARFMWKERFETIISWVDMKHLFLFPMYLFAKWILREKIVYWGQGRDLLDKHSLLKNFLYAAEQQICDAIILYAEHLKEYVARRHHHKVFVANNTVCPRTPARATTLRKNVLAAYGIRTTKNIVCIGRMQRRKKVEDVVRALSLMDRNDIGLMLVGPDTEGVLGEIEGPNIYKIGPLYGESKYELLEAADVCCLPGAAGLTIVDAFQSGLPFVTEAGEESAELTYLRDGINGFIVPRGRVDLLARALVRLLDDDVLRDRFSRAAKREMSSNGHIDRMCEGFYRALRYVIRSAP